MFAESMLPLRVDVHVHATFPNEGYSGVSRKQYMGVGGGGVHIVHTLIMHHFFFCFMLQITSLNLKFIAFM